MIQQQHQKMVLELDNKKFFKDLLSEMDRHNMAFSDILRKIVDNEPTHSLSKRPKDKILDIDSTLIELNDSIDFVIKFNE